jgi:hypothetical protein
MMRIITSVASLSLSMMVASGCASNEPGSGSGGGGNASPAGSATGGSSMGGSSTGGSSMGGSSTGGSSTGGSSTGGSNTGGSNTGGSNTGGSSTGGSSMGGSSTGGSATGGGAAGSGGSGALTPQPGMNFFVTSRSPGKGGNLGSLADADSFCKMLATAVSATLGGKTWRAYLSTATTNARDRIGTGPWRNQAGVVVANNLMELHQQEAGQALDATWPPMNLAIALDETGAQLPNDVHDILTGSNADGAVAAGATCNNWTSESMADTAQVGHSNRTGGGRPPYFNATHTVGCAPSATNRVSGTVTSGGGRGSFYCFALEPSSAP